MSRPAASTTRRTVKTEYIETALPQRTTSHKANAKAKDTGNKISRRAHIEGKQHIMLGGKSVIMAGVCLRGDLNRPATTTADGKKEPPITAISVGRGTVISTNCTLTPPSRLSRGERVFCPIRIGDNTFIGPETHISAVSISSNCHIGANCVLMPFCIIKECCQILDGTVVPGGMTVPPGSVVAGRPGRIVGEVPDGWGQGSGEDWVEGGDLRGLVRSIK